MMALAMNTIMIEQPNLLLFNGRLDNFIRTDHYSTRRSYPQDSRPNTGKEGRQTFSPPNPKDLAEHIVVGWLPYSNNPDLPPRLGNVKGSGKGGCKHS